MRALNLIAAAALVAAAVAPLPVVTPAAQARPAACAAYTPSPGSAERKAIMNAARPRIQAMVGKPVEFVVAQLHVACGYARLAASPQEKGGAGDHYEMVDILLIKRNGKWTFGMIAASEEGSDPAADQFKARYPNAPESLLYL